jgi:hypothetical protein
MSALVLLAFSSLASAAPAEPAPFAWSWPATPSHWHVETGTLTPRGVRYWAVNNTDGRAGSVTARGDTTCTFAPAGKKGWNATCTFDWLQLDGDAIVAREQESLKKVLREWASDMQAATYTFTVTPEGRMKAFDVQSRERQNLREGFIIESQRQLAQRIFCFFDLPLGKDAADWKRGWTHKGENQVLKLQTVSGTSGASEVKRRRADDQFGLFTVVDDGRATLSPGGAVDSSGTRLIDVRLTGQALLDPTDGTLVYRDATLDGRLTASSMQTGSDVEFYFMGALQRIPAPGAPGAAPLSVGAQRAPKLAGVLPDNLKWSAPVPFADLGMAAFFVEGLPPEATAWQLKTTRVKAQVEVNADGTVAQAVAYDGFAVLGAPTQTALAAAMFPKRDASYSVVVDVEWREAKAP